MGFWDHQSEGGQWLRVGRHTVKITSYTQGKSASGKSYVEFIMADRTGAKHKEAFYTTDAAMWRLVNFASACGMTQESHPNPGFADFVGKYTVIDLVPQESNPKYCQIGNFMSVEQAKSAPEPAPIETNTAPATEGGFPF